MKKVLLGLFLLSGLASAAQLPTYKVDIGQSLNDVMSLSDFYRYPAFQNARVQFRDGYVKQARMNLGWLSGRMEFIDPKGDTLLLEGVDDLANVAIGTDTFFFYGGALQQVAAWKGAGRLLQRQQLREEGSVKVGGYDANDPSGSVEAITRYNSYNSVRSVAVRQRTTYVRDSKLYYWKDNTSEPVELDRKTTEKIFRAAKQRSRSICSPIRWTFACPRR